VNAGQWGIALTGTQTAAAMFAGTGGLQATGTV
jgi:hypothetical protein